MPDSELIVSVYNNSDNTVELKNLEEYLVGVIIGEMPATYELEALKAQAVAARTYIMRNIGSQSSEHHGADICNNPSHCKAWVSPDDASEKWGNDQKKQYLEKIEKAVHDTKGEYMTYNDEIIEAVFCSNCGGKTENSKDIWGGDLPYLKSVSSDGDVSSPSFSSSLSVSLDDFKSRLSVSSAEIENIVRTQGGSVSKIEIGEKTFKGTEIRKIFDLKSANFTVNVSDKTVSFNVKGYGHGVGMSQYGANFMAKQGADYKKILKHYYSGITIKKNVCKSADL